MTSYQRLLGRLQLFDGKPCPYCCRSMAINDLCLAPTRDHHPVPKSKGGRRTIVVCHQCNNIKGDRSAVEWAVFMVENPEWWVVKRKVPRVRHVRFIKQAEKPSTPMAEPLSVLKLTGMIGQEFERKFRS